MRGQLKLLCEALNQHLCLCQVEPDFCGTTSFLNHYPNHNSLLFASNFWFTVMNTKHKKESGEEKRITFNGSNCEKTFSL